MVVRHSLHQRLLVIMVVIVVRHSCREFDVIKFDIIKVNKFLFDNITLNEYMLDVKHIENNKK